MPKKQIIITVIIVVVVAAIASTIYLPSIYFHTLNAVKLDAHGNEIGHARISVQGKQWNSLLLPDRLLAAIDSFDNISAFDVDSSEFSKYLGQDYLHRSFAIADIGSKEDMMNAIGNKFEDYNPTAHGYHVSISQDFDRWLIHVSIDGTEDVYYLASVSQDYTTQELLEFFKDRLPR